ncbi:MAG TPA: deoxyribodipyrimidine photo-lyase, partial [Solirubrobacteraceae bacterium]
MAPSTAVVWFRRDLRVHDHPALAEAVREFDRVVPLFVFDPELLGGRFRSHNRTAWLRGALQALDGELRERGGRLVIRHGRPETKVCAVARDAGARAVYVSDDVTAFARNRDGRVAEALERDDVELRRRPGLWVADDLDAIRTGQGTPYT